MAVGRSAIGNQCTIDIDPVYLAGRCANALGSLRPKKVTAWDAIIVDISIPNMEGVIRSRIDICRGWGEFGNAAVDYTAKPTVPLFGKAGHR